MRSRLSRQRRYLAVSIVLLGTGSVLVGTDAMPFSASVACACEGGGNELVVLGWKPGDLTWLSGNKENMNETIGIIHGKVKLLKQSTTDETDFEPTDPNSCMGKSLTSSCTVVIKRKTLTMTGVKRYVLEYEEESNGNKVEKDNVNLLEGR